MSRPPQPYHPLYAQSPAYQSLVANQPTLAQRADAISNKFGEFYHLVQKIDKHMHTLPPTPQETQAYANYCLQVERTLREQEGILRGWEKLAHVDIV